MNSEFFVIIIFSRRAFKDIFATLKIRQSDYAISRGCYFHEIPQPRSFTKIKPSRMYSFYKTTMICAQITNCYSLNSFEHEIGISINIIIQINEAIFLFRTAGNANGHGHEIQNVT